MRPSGTITLLTDFGLHDPYVGIMKGVLLSINPAVQAVDLTHDIDPADLAQAAAILLEAYPYFAPGTVHLVVVDPGVGGDRRPMVLRTPEHLFVGPDNGVLWPVAEAHPSAELTHLTDPKWARPSISSTFHGRDVFAPAAAHLSLGVAPRMMGPPLRDPVRLTLPRPTRQAGELKGVVLRVDRFGNLLTNIPVGDIRAVGTLLEIRVGKMELAGLARTYGDARPGQALALIGSSGHLEIAVNRGRACDRVAATPSEAVGLPVRVKTAGP